jgi:prephenate dehydratase
MTYHTYDLPKLNKGITSNETVIKSLPTKKTPGIEVFIAEFYQAFKEERTAKLLKLFHIIKEKEAF